jgi:hypothetical protein
MRSTASCDVPSRCAVSNSRWSISTACLESPPLWWRTTPSSFVATTRVDVPLLILGETGTGKEIVARAAHDCSERTGRCVAVNCGAIAPTLVESELFGYRRGAFSGATEDRLGLFQTAEGGTLFLDEIAELTPHRTGVRLLLRTGFPPARGGQAAAATASISTSQSGAWRPPTSTIVTVGATARRSARMSRSRGMSSRRVR